MFIRVLFSALMFLFVSTTRIAAQETTSQTTTPNDGSENFEINLKSTYTITANGKTIVEQKFSIKNKSPELFVSKYGIVVSSTNITNVEVTNNDKTLQPSISKQKGQTSIGVTFEENVVGEGKSNELLIRYTDSDIALISGKILEVNIPKLSDHYQYKNYQLELRVPSIFGNPSRINPSVFTIKQDGDYNVITYNDLKDQSVSAIFGNQQIFELKLNYYLSNPTSQNALTQITLPPETPYQKVFYINLDPMPKNIKEDQDGNFIATYEIPANNSFNVELFAQVLLTLSSDPLVPFSPVLPEHIGEQKYWEAKSQTIENINHDLDSVKSIYDFTVKALNYTKRPLNQEFARLGAIESIKENNKDDATCQEFTDLFIALARGKKLPARRIIGMAYTNNEELRPSNLTGDILHTWPEYYDSTQESWVRVDPTWEDTTGGIDYFNNFDLNHIAFAINGVSSTLPYPAGSYIGDAAEKNKKVYLEFSKEEFAQINPDLEVNLVNKKLYGIAVAGNYDLEILNKTGRVWYFNEIKVNGEGIEISMDSTDKIKKILPFSKLILPMTIYNIDNSLNKKVKIQTEVILKEGQSQSNEFEVKAGVKLKITNPKKIALMGGGFILFALVAGSLFLLGSKLKNSLRRKSQESKEEGSELQENGITIEKNPKDDSSGKQSGTSSS